MENPERLDLTAIEPVLWHPALLARYDALRPGQQLIVNNDIEARPLYHLLTLERGRCFSWEPLEKGPGRWTTSILRNPAIPDSETLCEIITRDYRKAAALTDVGIDFSCSGQLSLEQAFQGKEQKLPGVLQKWKRLDPPIPEKQTDFLGWNLSFLTKYIIKLHHGFVSTQTRFVSELAFKVADSNQIRNPEIRSVAEVFSGTGKAMERIAGKEENELFPYILALAEADAGNKPLKEEKFRHLALPVAFLQTESEKITTDLCHIRELTNNFTAPAYTSSTCPILYKLLAAYEEDALLHLHLENNILFPKAVQAEHRLRSGRLLQ